MSAVQQNALEAPDPGQDPKRKKLKKKQRKKEKKKAKKRAQFAVRDALVRSGMREPEPGGPGGDDSDDPFEDIDDLLNTPLARAWLQDNLDANGNPPPPVDPNAPGVIAPLPRRARIAPGAGESKPQMARNVNFSAGFFFTFGRLFVWLSGFARFFLGNWADALLGRNTIERRAVRLRKVFEKMGPTFVKVAQQLSLRADVLPYVYCEELAKMQDAVPPFPTEVAIEIIERNLGRPVTDVFSIFDPKPIGSASLACVFQAMRKSGEKVAVKVRRPGIGRSLSADLRALGWLMDIAETMTLLRPDMTRNLAIEFRVMLLEELDFHREARYTDIFRERADEMSQQYVRAPHVHHDISTDEVLVTEFVSGVFMTEILGALDRNDEESLAQMRERGIDARVLAKRLTKIFNWETLENLIFHADPHSANIVVQPGNTIVFLDFGSCGHFPARNRRLWRQVYMHLNNEDITGVVGTMISLMEPLPPVDLHRLTKELEANFRDWLFALKSERSEWWERSSGVLWFKLVSVARRYGVPFQLDMLRLFRTLLAGDAIIYRLWRGLDRDKEFTKYRLAAGRRAKKRVMKAVNQRLDKGLLPDDYLRIEEMFRTMSQFGQRMQHFLDTPSPRFADVLGKASYGVSLLLRLSTMVVMVFLFVVIALMGYRYLTGEQVSVGGTVFEIISSVPYQLALAVAILFLIRRMRMRFEDLDVER